MVVYRKGKHTTYSIGPVSFPRMRSLWQSGGAGWKAIRTSGGIIFDDDMSDPNVYRYDLYANEGALRQFSDEISYGGGGSIKISTPPVAGKRVQLTEHVFTPSRKMTYEVIVTTPLFYDFILETDCAYHKGAPEVKTIHRWDAGIRINGEEKKIQYKSQIYPEVKWTDIPGVEYRRFVVVYRPSWHRLRLTVDWDKLEYVSCSLDDLEFDLSGIPVAPAGPNHNVQVLSFNVRLETRINKRASVYIGRIRVLEET